MDNMCYFGIHLSKSETALTEFVKCDDSEPKLFSALDEDLQQMIVERSCVNEVEENVMICFNHEKLLGHDFRLKVNSNKNCLWPSHSKKRKDSTLRNPFPIASGNQKKQSKFLFATHGILLPFESKVCKICSVKCKTNLVGFVEDEVRSPVIRRSALNVDFDVDSSQSIVPSELSTQDSVYTMPSQEKE